MDSYTNTSEDKSEFISNLSILRQTHLFSSLPMDAVKLFAFLSTREFYRQGEYIFKTGDDDGCSYYILKGKAELFLAGEEKKPLRSFSEESFLGALSMLHPMPRLFSLKVSEELTAIVMTREKFSKVIERFPGLTIQIIRAVGERITQSEKRTIERYKRVGKDIVDLLGDSLI